jgi:CheY-like chemotaxis protein
MIVDDDNDFMGISREVFISEDFVTIPACDGISAITAFEQNEPDIVVLDQDMPGMNGVKTVKEIEINPDTPVIMLTALRDIDLIEEGFESGVHEFMFKPKLPKQRSKYNGVGTLTISFSPAGRTQTLLFKIFFGLCFNHYLVNPFQEVPGFFQCQAEFLRAKRSPFKMRYRLKQFTLLAFCFYDHLNLNLHDDLLLFMIF